MKKVLCLITFILLYTVQLSGITDQTGDISFHSTDIRTALQIISEIFKTNIIIPESINELEKHVTYQGYGKTAEEVLDGILYDSGFKYVKRHNDIFIEEDSGADIEYDKSSGDISIESTNANLKKIIETVASITRIGIDYSGINDRNVNFTFYRITIEDFFEILRISHNIEYTLVNDTYILSDDSNKMNSKKSHLTFDGDFVSLRGSKVKSSEVIRDIFYRFKISHCFVTNDEFIIEEIDITGLRYDRMLDKIFELSSLTGSIKSGIYYIYSKKIESNTLAFDKRSVYHIKNWTIKDFIKQCELESIPQKAITVIPESNSLLVRGTESDVDSYIRIIKAIDDAVGTKTRVYYSINGFKPDEIASLLPLELKNNNYSILNDKNLFYISLNEDEKTELDNIISPLKEKYLTFDYVFKNLKVSDLDTSHLPKHYYSGKIIKLKSNNSIHLNADKSYLHLIESFFKKLDTPLPVIRYQMLIVEYRESSDFNLDWGAGIKKSGGDFDISGGIFYENSGMVGVNIDIPLVFGYSFFVKLQNQLHKKEARIEMATEIFGISNETVSISNTQTMHYKDNQINDDGTAVPSVGSTTFGLQLEITGRASGDEIFLDINTRLSDQLSSSRQSDAPDTSEKSIKNTLRTKSGVPIVLGSLTTKKEDKAQKILPGLGQIPGLGNLFRTHKKMESNSEFIVYIVPFIDRTEHEKENERHKIIKRLYKQYKKNLKNNDTGDK